MKYSRDMTLNRVVSLSNYEANITSAREAHPVMQMNSQQLVHSLGLKVVVLGISVEGGISEL